MLKSATPSLRLQKFSYRFAEQVPNSKLALKDEIDRLLLEPVPSQSCLSRPGMNKLLDERFCANGWTKQPAVFDAPDDPGARMDFLKERIGIEVGFGHAPCSSFRSPHIPPWTRSMLAFISSPDPISSAR
ncbi:MAG: BglII/BstYI family type II restriction endonuclease [Acidobacteriota bacterium]|nr:BglII/BstYI family type II restriction endonuclease [Acidobacteriota bacterium]